MVHHKDVVANDEPEFDVAAPSRSARIGMTLFVVYAAFYAGFVFLNAFAPTQMERTPIAGLNIAIIYGFALIIMAFVLAIAYGLLCRDKSGAN